MEEELPEMREEALKGLASASPGELHTEVKEEMRAEPMLTAEAGSELASLMQITEALQRGMFEPL